MGEVPKYEFIFNAIQAGDFIRKFNNEIGVVFICNGKKVIAYKDGWDYVADIVDEIKVVVRPSEPWMYSPSKWDDDRIWREHLVYNTTIRIMTKEELDEAEDIHAQLGYTLIIGEN